LAWTDGFNLGISGGFSYADANANARAYTVNLKDGECGYFTIVPVFKDVCGSITEGFDILGGTWEPIWVCKPTNTYANICVSEQRLNPSGTVDAETIFVKTNCGTRQPLDPSHQDEVYRKPHVPMDRGKYDVLASTWAHIEPGSDFPPYSVPQCGVHGYTMPVADVQNVNKELDSKAGEMCCTPEIGGCANAGASGGKAIDICAPDGKKLCVDCSRLANYVAGLESKCVQDGKVGGSQDIVETPGLKVEI